MVHRDFTYGAAEDTAQLLELRRRKAIGLWIVSLKNEARETYWPTIPELVEGN
jgi:hypothetical protein